MILSGKTYKNALKTLLFSSNDIIADTDVLSKKTLIKYKNVIKIEPKIDKPSNHISRKNPILNNKTLKKELCSLKRKNDSVEVFTIS